MDAGWKLRAWADVDAWSLNNSQLPALTELTAARVRTENALGRAEKQLADVSERLSRLEGGWPWRVTRRLRSRGARAAWVPVVGGRCEQFVRTAPGFPGQYPSANAAWAAAGEASGDFNPPAGVPVFWALTGPECAVWACGFVDWRWAGYLVVE